MKNKKTYKIISFIILLLVVLCAFGKIYATVVDPSTIFDPNNMPSPNENIGRVNSSINKVWGSVTLILQIASVSAVVFAGVKYMFASADQRADIKKSMIFLVIGAIFVFGASTVINFIVRAFTDIVGGST